MLKLASMLPCLGQRCRLVLSEFIGNYQIEQIPDVFIAFVSLEDKDISLPNQINSAGHTLLLFMIRTDLHAIVTGSWDTLN